LVTALDSLDRHTHSFSKGTAMEDLGGLLTTLASVSVQLVLSMSAVVHADRLDLLALLHGRRAS